MRKWVVAIAVLVLLGGAGNLGAAPVYVYDGGLGTWSDVNKTSVTGSESLLCWAAAASNVLAWTGWTGWNSVTDAEAVTAAEIYSIFLAGWTNRLFSPTEAYEWWMTDQTASSFGSTFDSAGQNFYPTIEVDPHQSGSYSNFVDIPASSLTTWLNTYVTADRGITLGIDVPCPAGSSAWCHETYGHVLTVWGYDPTTGNVFVTDSDDGVTGLQTYHYYLSAGNYYLSGYSNLYTPSTTATITELTRLNRNATGIEPNHGTTAVPEPTTLMLFATGIAGLLLRKKR